MASIRQILTDWTTYSGSGKVSVMYFDAAVAVATQRTALQAFWTALAAGLDNGASWAIRTSGIDVDDGTGQLVNNWSETSSKIGSGVGTTESVADATQVLIRWHTSTILGARFLQGRTYVPGLGIGNLQSGNILPGTVTAYNTAANTLAASSAELMVWHRPVSGSGGSAHQVTSGSCWTELAVLRRRRG